MPSLAPILAFGIGLLPMLWCAFHVVKSSSHLLLGRAVDRFGPRPFLCLGWVVDLVGSER